MSDLTDRDRDQGAAPSTRMRPGNRLASDRSLRLSDLSVALFLLVVGCVHAGPEPIARLEVHRPEFWVDAFSPAGGDGSKAHPFKVLAQPVPPGATLHFRTGLYAGPFVLGAGARLEGLGEVVLTGEAGQTVVVAEGATLEGISIQGGDLGLEAGPGVVVTRTHFSGQRRRAVVVHGSLTLSETRLEASVEGIDGVVVDRGATLEVNNTKFLGGFRRAVMTDGGTLRLSSVWGEGPKTLVHAIDGKSDLANVHSVLGSGPALFFAGGTVHVSEAEVIGHEYSVQLSRVLEAHLSGLVARSALEGCISAIGSSLRVSHSTLTQCGPAGAVALQDSKTALIKVDITSAHELGIFAARGSLHLMDVTVSKVAHGPQDSMGDAVHLRDGAAVTSLGGLLFSDLDGSGLFASSLAEVQLASLTVDRARKSALFVERGASVGIRALRVRGGAGAAVVALDRARVVLDSLTVSGGNEMPVYAECGAGAQVSLGQLDSTVQQLPSQCVSLRSTPP